MDAYEKQKTLTKEYQVLNFWFKKWSRSFKKLTKWKFTRELGVFAMLPAQNWQENVSKLDVI